MPQLLYRLLKIASLSLLLLTAQHSLLAKPIQQSTAQREQHIYSKAARELPQNLYVLYRVVERLSRANQLDEHPWRILISPEYDINAYATEVNLLIMGAGMLDQLAGDDAAIACIVGHEMAHHTQRHVAKLQAETQRLETQIQQEAQAEVNRERNQARIESTAASVTHGLLGNLLNTTVGSVGHSVIQNAIRRRTQNSEARVQIVMERKQAELHDRLNQFQRQQEFEADEVGYFYAATAGYEAAGCLRAERVLARMPQAELDTTHPMSNRRILAFQTLMTRYPVEKLATVGRNRLKNTQPLTYAPSEDGRSLRINSRFVNSPRTKSPIFSK